jgi:hypothetical protein
MSKMKIASWAKSTGDGALREQTLGNVETVIAHRQNVPESAELIAHMAGTKAVWITTQQTDEGLLSAGPSGRGTRRRGYEFQIHPSHIKQLPTGQAVVITPGGGPPTTALVHHPQASRLWAPQGQSDGLAVMTSWIYKATKRRAPAPRPAQNRHSGDPQGTYPNR